MEAKLGFRDVRQRVLDALLSGRVIHAFRRDRQEKNLLDMGVLCPADVVDIVRKARGNEHACSPHHRDPSTDVHVLRRAGWYLKFVLLDDHVEFLSVHRSEP
jgi:hypothetical protein